MPATRPFFRPPAPKAMKNRSALAPPASPPPEIPARRRTHHAFPEAPPPPRCYSFSGLAEMVALRVATCKTQDQRNSPRLCWIIEGWLTFQLHRWTRLCPQAPAAERHRALAQPGVSGMAHEASDGREISRASASPTRTARLRCCSSKA